MAKDKKNNGGGSNGDGGAPAEAHVEPTLQTDATPADIPPDAQADPADDAPPDFGAKSTEELKACWLNTKNAIEDFEARIAAHSRGLRLIEQELCARAKEAAKGAEPIVMIGGRRLKVKARPARIGGGLGFVDAPVNAAIEL